MDGVVYIKKEQGWTSFDVVAKCRRILNEKSVGHTGTLDPNAEGLLIVLVGKACKCLPYCEHNDKEYIATFKLGQQTDTGDIWGEVVDEKQVPECTLEQFENICKEFVGQIQQTPPQVSAIKINGKKAIDYHREGKEVKLTPRDITIYELECLSYGDEIMIRALVSSGTYIRTLCEDLAKRMGTVGTMTSLVRTKIGAISLDQAVKMDELTTQSIHPINEVLNNQYPHFEVSDVEHVKQGKRVRLDCNEPLVLLTHQGEILAAYELVEENMYKSKRGLW